MIERISKKVTIKKMPLILLGIVLLGSCGTRRMAKGPSDIVYVVAAEDVRQKVKAAIDTTFSFGIRTPEFQHYYLTNWRPLNELGEVIYLPHSILVADMNVSNAASQLVKSLLSAKRLESIKADTVALFALPDVWEKTQIMIIAAGYDMEKLADFIRQRQGWLFSKIDQKYIERQSHFLFNEYEQKELSRKIRRKYGWTMRIPSDFQIIRESPEAGFLWLGRALPYRWISVTWEPGIQTEWLTANGLFKKREKIGRIYGQIKTEKRFLGHKYAKFAGFDALRMWGLWYHEEKPQGGPFMTYAFYDSYTDQSFIIDMLVYSPGERVLSYLRQMEIMATTFRTKDEAK